MLLTWAADSRRVAPGRESACYGSLAPQTHPSSAAAWPFSPLCGARGSLVWFPKARFTGIETMRSLCDSNRALLVWPLPRATFRLYALVPEWCRNGLIDLYATLSFEPSKAPHKPLLVANEGTGLFVLAFVQGPGKRADV